MGELEKKLEKKARRIRRVRKRIFGTSERPRVAFTKTNRHLHIQIINDIEGKTLFGISTEGKEIKEMFKGKKSLKNKEVAKKMAEIVAEKALAQNIKKVVFDRRGRKYMGVVKVFADTLREKGLEL